MSEAMRLEPGVEPEAIFIPYAVDAAKKWIFRNLMLSEQQILSASVLLTALENAKRLEILLLLVDGRELTVGTLAQRVGLSQSALSQHLSRLRAANAVSTRRDAQVIYYSCRSAEVKAILNALRTIYGDVLPSENTPGSR